MVTKVDLPKARDADGNPPSSGSLFVSALAEQVMAEREPYEFAVEGTRIRGSYAGSCARQVAYRVMGVEETNPIDEAAAYVMWLGNVIHDKLQDAVEERFPNATSEYATVIPDLNGSCHIDIVLAGVDPEIVNEAYGDRLAAPFAKPVRVAVEAKSINGYGYKLALGDRGPAKGPRWGDFLQGCVNALSYDADLLVMCYVAAEVVSKGQARRKKTVDINRIGGEWPYARADYQPFAEVEIARLGKVLTYVDDEKLPPRVIPDVEIPRGAVVVDPKTGRWEQVKDGQVIGSGSTWVCPDYCSWRDRCIEDGA